MPVLLCIDESKIQLLRGPWPIGISLRKNKTTCFCTAS
jgi:hypothetical protein